MNFKKEVFKTSRRAEAGIGTLILFIAFILVAAITASVLITTSSSLQSKALTTGSKTAKQVSTGISVISIYGENASNTPQIGYIYATIRLSPGSEPLQLNASLVDVFTSDESSSYKFNQSGNCSFDWLSNSSVSRGYFAVEGKEGYTSSGLMQDGDVLLVCTKLLNVIGESSKVSWQFTPKNGAFTRVKTETPHVMSTARTFLYPN